MIEFDTFCYLQNQRTGSTYVEKFLRACSAEPVRSYRKHDAVPEKKPDKFYFVNVREPVDIYRSLFNYGLDGRGQIRGRLGAAGRGDLYRKGIAGFETWLDFVLDPDQSHVLHPGYTRATAAQVGLVSYRFLRLACPGFTSQCGRLSSAAQIAEHFERNDLLGAVVHYETLTEDLRRLVVGPLRHAMTDSAAAEDWLCATPPINPSNRRDRATPGPLGAKMLDTLRLREWFLYERFYAT